jgi:sirohydrochlorin ferrochelatase
MTGYIVFAHGSSVEPANEAVRKVALAASERADWKFYETAFLGGGEPALAGAVDMLAARGVRHIVVIPYFLTMGLHLERDLPALVDQIRRAHPSLKIEVTAPLDGHPGMVDAVLDRARSFEKPD